MYTVDNTVNENEIESKLKTYVKSIGPGLITGAADDDPSGIATYSQVGARFGFQYTWLALFTLPLLYTMQEMCARIGLATGHGIVWHIRRLYKPWVLYVSVGLLFVANIFNIAADLRAMAEASRLIIPQMSVVPAMIAVAVTSAALEVWLPYRIYAQYLKFFTLSLLAYIMASFLARPDWWSVINNIIIPRITMNADSILMIVAVLGTTISPYLFFWQTAEEIEEELTKSPSHKTFPDPQTHSEMRLMRSDVLFGMVAGNIVMLFIMIACGATLHVSGITNIETASQAAEALFPVAGRFAGLLFALGILGTGFLALPVLAGSLAYAVSEVFGWREGLRLGAYNGRAFYGVIGIAFLLGLVVNYLPISAIQQLYYSAIVNAVAAPFIIYLIIRIASRSDIMGKWRNSSVVQIIAYSAFVIMACGSLFSLAFALKFVL